MFQKLKLKAKINRCKKEINRIERKRSRSQAALVEAILTHTTPEDEDVDYFNKYTAQINQVRDVLVQAEKELGIK